MKNVLKMLILCFPIVTIQACSSPKQTENSNSDTIVPKEFGDRFSSENIKKERELFYAQKRLELKRTTPSADVKKALKSNNIYLMEVPEGRGGNRSIPGLIEFEVLQVNCKTVPAQGMGDVLYGKNHILYRQELLAFMREFNILMMPYCK